MGDSGGLRMDRRDGTREFRVIKKLGELMFDGTKKVELIAVNPAAKYLLIKQNPSPAGLSESKSAKIVRSK